MKGGGWFLVHKKLMHSCPVIILVEATMLVHSYFTFMRVKNEPSDSTILLWLHRATPTQQPHIILRCIVCIFISCLVYTVVVVLCVLLQLYCVYCCSCIVYTVVVVLCVLLQLYCVYCCSCLLYTVVVVLCVLLQLSCVYCCSCLVCIVVVVLCVLLQFSCVYCCHLMCTCCTMCLLLFLLQMPDCWLEVSIRKVLRPATSTQVFLGFPVSISKC